MTWPSADSRRWWALPTGHDRCAVGRQLYAVPGMTPVDTSCSSAAGGRGPSGAPADAVGIGADAECLGPQRRAGGIQIVEVATGQQAQRCCPWRRTRGGIRRPVRRTRCRRGAHVTVRSPPDAVGSGDAQATARHPPPAPAASGRAPAFTSAVLRLLPVVGGQGDAASHGRVATRALPASASRVAPAAMQQAPGRSSIAIAAVAVASQRDPVRRRSSCSADRPGEFQRRGIAPLPGIGRAQRVSSRSTGATRPARRSRGVHGPTPC